MNIKKILYLEEFVIFLLTIYVLIVQFSVSWWVLPILFLLPDIGMIGYLINSKVGAFTYNLFHTKLFGVFLLSAGLYRDIDMLMLSGIIIFGHAAMDRYLGYGLKYSDSFWHTHLGNIK